MERLAAFFSSQVRGAMPLNRKTSLQARLTQTMFTASSKPAPAARSKRLCPISRPTVAAGGNRATATMTPTRTLDRPVVSERAAAAPEASASKAESRPTSVRASNSRLRTVNGQSAPMAIASSTASAMPTTRVTRDRRIRSTSPSAVPRPKARFGPSSGAMTIAPITTATLSSTSPMAATMVDRVISTMKFMSSSAFFSAVA